MSNNVDKCLSLYADDVINAGIKFHDGDILLVYAQTKDSSGNVSKIFQYPVVMSGTSNFYYQGSENTNLSGVAARVSPNFYSGPCYYYTRNTSTTPSNSYIRYTTNSSVTTTSSTDEVSGGAERWVAKIIVKS